jgi:adenosine deaminase
VKRTERHPIVAFLEAGVKVAICCDNTTVSRTDQVKESALVASLVGLETVERLHREAEGYSFIRPESALADIDD